MSASSAPVTAHARSSLQQGAANDGKGNQFALEYAKLNPDQRKAVETIEGPVLCIAGPGTGKTQVVAMRVANILNRTQMRPGNILCLTFSNSGATAMRERLRSLIGADAYGVRVSTIHSFAQSIIEDNAFLFDEWSAREQISDLLKVQEMNTIIDQISSQSALINPKDPYGKTQDILARISEAKREGKTTEDLLRAADEYDRAMEAKSKPGTKVYEKNLLAARKFRDFVGLFERYQSMLERTGRYDYDDSILHVIRALKEEDWLLASLQERFQYVLVDEYQDTNGAQSTLIELLTTYESVSHDPNLFIVGDDDQAIYRFQGANLENMLAFHKRFPQAPVIPLTISYRSTQEILNAAQSLIAHNTERLVGRIPGLEKVLTAATKEEGSEPQLLRSASDTAEPWLIADLVEERIGKGIHPEEIAILTQQNSELFPIFEVLRARGIPVLLSGKDDLLLHPLVLQAMTILEAIEKPHVDSRLAGALGCSCFGLEPADLGRLHGQSRERKIHLIDLLLSLPPQSDLPLVDRTNIERVRDLLLDLHQKIPSRTALETVEHVLRGCHLIPEPQAHAALSIDPRDVAAVEAFFSFVRSQCLERRSCSFDALLSDLRTYRDPTFGQVRLTYEIPHLTRSGVRLMTAHQSKGLEFHTVILSNFRDGHWDRKIRRSGISVPEDLVFGWGKEQKDFEKNQDERRIAFVAATRAKRELLMICPCLMSIGEKSRAIAPSGFFAEMGPLPEADAELRHPESASLLLRPKPVLPSDALKGYIEERLQTFMLSATALNRFLRNPSEFLLVDLLNQPEHFSEASVRRLAYGSAVHWALRQWATAHKEGRSFSVQQMLDAFEWYLRERTILTDRQREDLLSLSKDALPRYVQQRLQESAPFLHAIEHDYRAHLGDVPLKGKIDRIDRLSADSAVATVIDYKAGAGKTESEIRGGLEPGRVSHTEQGSHFRQLAFYAVLLEQAEPLLTPREFVLEYIGERGEHPVTRSFVVDDREREDMKKLIRSVWAKIVAQDFTPISGADLS